MQEPISIDELCRRYEAIYSGALSDILDEMGYTNQVLPSYIKPLQPGMRVTGKAFTVRGVPTSSTNPDDIFVPLLKMYGEVPKGSVLINTPNDDRAAHMGELSATALKARGCRGAIIDGGARDVEYILDINFPVFSRYTTPADIVGRWRVESYGIPITIGQVKIHPGDFVVADRDGIVIVPADLTMEVLLKAEELVSTENLVRKAIIDGSPPLDAYYKYGRF